MGAKKKKSFIRRLARSAIESPVVRLATKAAYRFAPQFFWTKVAQPGEFSFHKRNRLRNGPRFARESTKLFEGFGFSSDDFAGRVVVDLGAGSKLRTKFFKDAKIAVIEPLADRFRNEIEWSDLKDAWQCHSVPAEQRVQALVGQAAAVISINVIDHCYELDAILANVRAYLAADGLAFLSFDSHEVPDRMHPLVLTEETSEEAFRRAGLRVEKKTRGLGPGRSTYGHGETINFWLRPV